MIFNFLVVCDGIFLWVMLRMVWLCWYKFFLVVFEFGCGGGWMISFVFRCRSWILIIVLNN